MHHLFNAFESVEINESFIMKLLDLMILSGLPQTIIATRFANREDLTRTTKICDFPGYKAPLFEHYTPLRFINIKMPKNINFFSLSNALWGSLRRKNVQCKNKIWWCQSVGITLGHENFGGKVSLSSVFELTAPNSQGHHKPKLDLQDFLMLQLLKTTEKLPFNF